MFSGIRFVSSSHQPLKGSESEKHKETGNKDEIDIGDDSDDDTAVADVKLSKQAIPSAVFGKLDKENED